ncbi:adenosylcobinamide-GDP ribazoletransferase (plasmid) [Cytobacillus spongiae]|uniref:adenosylcobinamide-GDP ribazoletransferase n=1 Tax=Cytobacillus spongiae TaxID=2901381 RepID=UPI00145D888E|nr:adenosylcobinamide-GDP ribazoletransferase [Cytobacillus spongiae]NMH70221.1 adenosylcobinamide-GDP ribazoletransferase [Bacillus sp. RO3]UII58494.1 adenosylcobinamide-GDP ribazoletransferase [Cytobacillus spongiae]
MLLMKSFFLNLQFFTIVPIRREMRMGNREYKWMVRTFPLLGLFVGVILLGGYSILHSYTQMTTLGLSFFIWVLPIVLTGGIHLDGYMDASDALFSYRDREKRLDIMKDPRVGAFGVLSVVVLLSSRFLFIYETVLHTDSALTFSIILVLIPFFSRIMMAAILVLIPPARNAGMGYHFSKNLKVMDLSWVIGALVLAGIGSFLLGAVYYYALFTVVTLVVFWLSYTKSLKWFGGMNGDTIGGSVEGVESVLWMILWFHAFSAY